MERRVREIPYAGDTEHSEHQSQLPQGAFLIAAGAVPTSPNAIRCEKSDIDRMRGACPMQAVFLLTPPTAGKGLAVISGKESSDNNNKSLSRMSRNIVTDAPISDLIYTETQQDCTAIEYFTSDTAKGGPSVSDSSTLRDVSASRSRNAHAHDGSHAVAFNVHSPLKPKSSNPQLRWDRLFMHLPQHGCPPSPTGKLASPVRQGAQHFPNGSRAALEVSICQSVPSLPSLSTTSPHNLQIGTKRNATAETTTDDIVLARRR